MPRFELVRPAVPSKTQVNPFTRRPFTTPAIPEVRQVLEIELVGNRVERWSPGGTRSSREFATREEAEASFLARVAKARRQGYRSAGPSEVLAGDAAPRAASHLLLDDLFTAGDPRFVDEVLASIAEKKLATLAAPWMADTRPGMRRALLDYIDDGCDRFGHKALVKRIYKLAESKADDELMAHFLVAFDRLHRRRLVPRRPVWRSPGENALASSPFYLERLRKGETSGSFTRVTRRYLARRAFRYFRRIGKVDPARYGRSIRAALLLYEDRHLDTPVRLLDAWSLLHVLYAWSPVLDRRPRGIIVAEGKQLKDLAPAPYWPAAWRGVEGDVFTLVGEAHSRPVRAWAIAWLRKEYPEALSAVPVDRLVRLLTSRYEEAVLLGAELLSRTTGLATLTVGGWKQLLAIDNLDALVVVCKAFEQFVAPERVSLADSVALAMSSAAPVAELGLRWAKSRGAAAADLPLLGVLATAPLEPVRKEATAWVLTLLDRSEGSRGLLLRDLLDSRFADVRRAAAEYVERTKEAAAVPLWLSLLESPYDDVRALVVKHATAWESEAEPSDMRRVAATVILAVHRGAAAKRAMLRQIADRLVRQPADADHLLPVLAIALRSVRAPERTGALLAIARAAVADERLREPVSRHFPGIVIDARASA